MYIGLYVYIYIYIYIHTYICVCSKCFECLIAICGLMKNKSYSTPCGGEVLHLMF